MDVLKTNDERSGQEEEDSTTSLTKMDSTLMQANLSMQSDPDDDTSYLSYKYVMEIVDQHIFVDEHCIANVSTDEDQVRSLCEKAFVDAVGMDMFLQILDDKRGRNSVLGEKGFDNMAIAMKVRLIVKL